MREVTPFVGVWIEIFTHFLMSSISSSLPSWECGLKFMCLLWCDMLVLVTPFVGVWIEMTGCRPYGSLERVTPFVGVWIEICEPSHACELNLVTPFVGVWIEIPFIY